MREELSCSATDEAEAEANSLGRWLVRALSMRIDLSFAGIAAPFRLAVGSVTRQLPYRSTYLHSSFPVFFAKRHDSQSSFVVSLALLCAV